MNYKTKQTQIIYTQTHKLKKQINMKKSIVKLVLAFSFSAFTFIGCSSNDDEPTVTVPVTSFVVNPDNFKGEIKDGDVKLDASKTYKLTGALIVRSGATLTIPAGTKIIAQNDVAYIAVAQGGKINANGTSTAPIVFTSVTGKPGSWGGIVICGKAPINKALTAQSEVAELTYGGNAADDNSGTLKYVRIEYAGKIITGDKEFNGLSLFGVGNGTKIEYVQAFHGSDDGFEFFGGTVNTKYLVSTGNEDDQFDWTEGWNGVNEFWFGQQGFSVANRGIEADNLEDNEAANPIANPTIKNLTLLGIKESGEPQGIELRRGTKALIDNVVISNFDTGIRISGGISQGFAGSGIKITNARFENVKTKYNPEAAKAITENNAATGAGSGVSLPDWAKGWTRTI